MSADVQASPSPPVGPPMKPREGIEFLVALAGLDLSKLVSAGQPENVADLDHVLGVLYELCRFTQAARSQYDEWVAGFAKAPERIEHGLEQAIAQVRKLMVAVADGEPYVMPLQSGTEIRVSGRQFQRAQFKSPLPFVIYSPKFTQAVVVFAIFYLGLTRDSCLVRRCKESNCGRLFMAIRQSRVFCSHECASAASVRNFRQKQKSKEA